MSVSVQAGVWSCGPDDQSEMVVLLAIADNADDLGWACPSHELIAKKARCSTRTVVRQIDRLEQDGWLGVLRKTLYGKCNVYVLNLAKMGVTLSPDAFISPLFTGIRKSHADRLSRIFLPGESTDTRKFSTDNPQPPQVTSTTTQVTKPGGSTATSCHTNSKNHENHGEPPANVEGTPLPPAGVEDGSGKQGLEPAGPGVFATAEERARWVHFRDMLYRQLCDVPLGLQTHRFAEVRPGVSDFEACFQRWWLVEVHRRPGVVQFITCADDEGATMAGVTKYYARLVRTLRLLFPESSPGERVEFTVRATAAQVNPAA